MRRVSEVYRRFLFRGKTQRRLHAFTLLELVVVVAIITVLGGIIVRVLPDLMKDTNLARLVANLREVDNLVQTFQAAPSNESLYPNGFDSLITTGTGELYSYLPKDGTTAVGGYLTVGTLTSTQITKLNNAGLTYVYDMQASPKWVTYMGSATSTKRDLATNGYAVFLAKDSNSSYSTLAGSVLRLEDDHDYIVLGVGRLCTLVGPTGMIKDTPVVTHNRGCQDPNETYCGVVAIFDLLSSTTSYRGAQAKFVGCVALAEDGFITGEQVANKVN